LRFIVVRHIILNYSTYMLKIGMNLGLLGLE